RNLVGANELQHLPDLAAHAVGEARADAAAVDQLPVFIGGQEEAPHVVDAVLRRAPTNHDELLSADALDLQPGGRPVAPVVPSRRGLRDDALEALLTRRPEHAIASADDVL